MQCRILPSATRAATNEQGPGGTSRTAQARFDGKESLGLVLLSHTSGEVARTYGVRRRFLTPVKGATFVIGRDGVVSDVISSELGMHVHADQALEALSRTQPAPADGAACSAP